MASADSFSKTVTKLVNGNDRPELLKIINLAFNQPLIADVQGLKHISLYSAKNRTLTMHGDLPFLNEGSATECCSGVKKSTQGLDP